MQSCSQPNFCTLLATIVLLWQQGWSGQETTYTYCDRTFGLLTSCRCHVTVFIFLFPVVV